MDAQDFRSLQEAYDQVRQLDEAVKGQDSDLRRAASSERQTEKAAHSKWKKSSPGTKKKPSLRFSSVPNTDITASGYADQQSQQISWHDKKTKGKFIHGMSRNEEADLYDIILSHLLDEGYAETPEAAEAIMVNMGEEWRESILTESSHLEPDMKKRRKENKKAIKDMKNTKAYKDMVYTIRKKFDEEYFDEALRSREERMARMMTSAQRKKQELDRKKKEELEHKASLVLAGLNKTAKTGEVTKSEPKKLPAPESNRKLKPKQKTDTLAVRAGRVLRDT